MVKQVAVRIVSLEEFLTMPAQQLSKMTGVPGARWSEWQRGRGLSERNLVSVSSTLGISPGTLLDWIILRRQSYSQNWEDTRAKY
ncbi:MAG: hypothetical protein KME30_27525 [Iphinoe sp. HA4291-MV1]|jgi:hypothetical protein|nr:hypothetical protein [Iphinoe sp. HA4291-MV1]